jgi:hypothetical protein
LTFPDFCPVSVMKIVFAALADDAIARTMDPAINEMSFLCMR